MSDVNENTNAEYGGYLELNLPRFTDPFSSALKYQSGRAALRAVLEFGKVKDVFLPRYVCSAVTSAALDSGAKIHWYDLDDELLPKGLPNRFPVFSKIIYVNYFGLRDSQVEQIANSLPRKNLIIDNCQALFCKPGADYMSIYSVRKFLGVPDGGLVMPASFGIFEPNEADSGSYCRLVPRLIRMQDSAKAGYSEYLKAELSLEETKPLAMSGLTRRLIQSIDLSRVKVHRRNNFLLLDKLLGDLNTFKWRLGADTVPLCYPMVLGFEAETSREQLLQQSIFLPSYWQELATKFEPNSIESRFIKNCLYLPCDQRYSESEIEYIATKTSRILRNEEKRNNRG